MGFARAGWWRRGGGLACRPNRRTGEPYHGARGRGVGDSSAERHWFTGSALSTVVVAAALVTASCALVTRTFTVVVPANSEFAEAAPDMTVSVVDRTGLLVDVAAGETKRGRSGGVRSDPDDASKLHVQWFGGFCDRLATFELRAVDEEYRLFMSIKADTPCNAEPAPAQRRIVLILNREVDPSTVKLIALGNAPGPP